MTKGYCDEKFREAREVFENSISSGFELGLISLFCNLTKLSDKNFF